MRMLHKLLPRIQTTRRHWPIRRLLFAICLASSGCVTSPPDVMGCANEVTRGYCRTFMTHKTIIIDNDKNLYVSPQTGKKYTWAQLVQISVIFPPNEWAVTKSWFDNFCHQSGNCQQGVGDWQTVVNDLSIHVGATK